VTHGGYRCHLCGRDDFVVPSLLRLHIEQEHPSE
jgi:hypothetical protein